LLPGPPTPLPDLLGVYLVFGIGLGTITPPITTSAVSGMPVSIAGVAASVASTSRQAGTALGVAVSGSAAGAAMARGGPAFTEATHTVWWIVAGLGLVIFALEPTGFKHEKWESGPYNVTVAN
jgi:MFS family permease